MIRKSAGYLALLAPLVLFVALLAGGLRSFGEAAGAPLSAGPSTLNYEVKVPGADGGEVRLPVRVHVPSAARGHQPLRVLVALHPFGGTGPGVAEPIVPFAEGQSWVLVAPTFPNRDWRDPELVRKDEMEFMPGLHSILAGLESRTGLVLEERVLLYGFSRGAQAAHRFALAYPEEVAAVAALSAGTYTLPQSTWKEEGAAGGKLSFPYGVADLEKYCGKPFDLEKVKDVQFWIGVGTNDSQPKDVPRNWDKYLGDCRLDRATAFAEALRSAGVAVEKVEFAHTEHVETAEMRAAALAFLSEAAP